MMGQKAREAFVQNEPENTSTKIAKDKASTCSVTSGTLVAIRVVFLSLPVVTQK